MLGDFGAPAHLDPQICLLALQECARCKFEDACHFDFPRALRGADGQLYLHFGRV